MDLASLPRNVVRATAPPREGNPSRTHNHRDLMHAVHLHVGVHHLLRVGRRRSHLPPPIPVSISGGSISNEALLTQFDVSSQVRQVLHGFDFFASLASHEAASLSSQERGEHQGVDRTSRRTNVAEASGSSACCGRDRVNFVFDQSRDAGRDGHASSLRRPKHNPAAEPSPRGGDDVVPSLKVREDATCAIVRNITKTNPFFFLSIASSCCVS